MANFVFTKDSDNVPGTLYKIAENTTDLNNLNIDLGSYKIIAVSQENFNKVKLNQIEAVKYNNDNITYANIATSFLNKDKLKDYLNNVNLTIENFLTLNPNHPFNSKWANYSNQLKSLNLDVINYPLDISLEEYLNNSGQNTLNILQLP